MALVHEVVEKASGHVARCSREVETADRSSRRTLSKIRYSAPLFLRRPETWRVRAGILKVLDFDQAPSGTSLAIWHQILAAPHVR